MVNTPIPIHVPYSIIMYHWTIFWTKKCAQLAHDGIGYRDGKWACPLLGIQVFQKPASRGRGEYPCQHWQAFFTGLVRPTAQVSCPSETSDDSHIQMTLQRQENYFLVADPSAQNICMPITSTSESKLNAVECICQSANHK